MVEWWIFIVLGENTKDEIKFWGENDEEDGYSAQESRGVESYGEATTCWAVEENCWDGEEVE